MSGAAFASSAIRRSFVETVCGLDVPAIFPSNDSVSRCTPFARQGPSGWFPRVIAPMAALRRLAPPLRFACRSARRFWPHGQRDEVLPSCWATLAYVPRSTTPADASAQGSRDGVPAFRARRCCLPPEQRCRHPPRQHFRGSIPRPACPLSTLRGHGHPCAAYDHARLASGWRPSTLTGRDFHPRVASKGFAATCFLLSQPRDPTRSRLGAMLSGRSVARASVGEE
jgi:hypothetical protein